MGIEKEHIEFDRKVSQKFAAHAVVPNAAVWEKISGELHQSDSENYKRRFLFWRATSVVLVISGIIGAIAIYNLNVSGEREIVKAIHVIEADKNKEIAELTSSDAPVINNATDGFDNSDNAEQRIATNNEISTSENSERSANSPVVKIETDDETLTQLERLARTETEVSEHMERLAHNEERTAIPDLKSTIVGGQNDSIEEINQTKGLVD
ncbi:hypothetical protein JYT72_03265, partial [Crocinitomix catalasitica]|nr:hypothetical protein [Crocinitomix catalasitica]